MFSKLNETKKENCPDPKIMTVAICVAKNNCLEQTTELSIYIANYHIQ